MKKYLPALGLLMLALAILLGALAISGNEQRQRAYTPTVTREWHYDDSGTVEYGCATPGCNYSTGDPGMITRWATYAPTDTPAPTSTEKPWPTNDVNNRPTMTCVHFSCTPGDATYSGPMFP